MKFITFYVHTHEIWNYLHTFSTFIAAAGSVNMVVVIEGGKNAPSFIHRGCEGNSFWCIHVNDRVEVLQLSGASVNGWGSIESIKMYQRSKARDCLLIMRCIILTSYSDNEEHF